MGSFEWSPDGRRIAFSGSDPRSEDEEKRLKNKEDVRVVDRNERPTRLWVIDVAGGTARRLTNGTWSFSELAWTPDGSALVAIGTESPDPNRFSERVVTVSADSGAIHVVLTPRGPFGGITVSPDGKLLTYEAAPVDGPTPHDLFVAPIGGGTARNLTSQSLDRPVGSVVWKDPTNLLVAVADGFSSRLADVAVDGAAKLLPALPVQPAGVTRSADGTIAFIGQSTVDAPELWLRAPGGEAERVTSLNARWKDRVTAKGEIFKYRSFDGREIEATWLAPIGYSRGTRVPLIVLVHGGPTGRWSDAFDAWGQLLATRGYAVLYPNIRGSSGYGQKFVEANRADWGGGDFKDVMAGVDAMIAKGIADSTKVGIGGWSYGGYMAMWAVTQTTRFRASVAGAGMSDLASEFGTEGSALYDEWFFGTPYEHQKEFIESSPITYIKRARTPTLILQGENDLTDPIGQSQQFYRGLRKYDVPTELALYPREGHGIREEQHVLDLYGRVIAWYDRWIRGAGTTP